MTWGLQLWPRHSQLAAAAAVVSVAVGAVVSAAVEAGQSLQPAYWHVAAATEAAAGWSQLLSVVAAVVLAVAAAVVAI